MNRLSEKRGGEEPRMVEASGMMESDCRDRPFGFLAFAGGGLLVVVFGVRSGLSVEVCFFFGFSARKMEWRGNVADGAIVMYSSIFS